MKNSTDKILKDLKSARVAIPNQIVKELVANGLKPDHAQTAAHHFILMFGKWRHEFIKAHFEE